MLGPDTDDRSGLLARGRHNLGFRGREEGFAYPDVRALEALRRLIGEGTDWAIPDDNRRLVESGTRVERFLGEADREVDRRFFDLLFDHALDEAAGGAAWLAFLERLARDTFERAVQAAPVAGARRYRALARAESMLNGALRKNFPDLDPKRRVPTHGA